MNQVNYQLLLDREIENIVERGQVPRLLMHSCCAPCSSYCLSYLAEYFMITVFYYNPNITSREEYEKRVAEQRRLIQELPARYPVSFVEGRYQPERFYEMAQGMEEVPEGGERCFACYELRQREAVRYAREQGFDYVTTTLSVSPHKNAQKLNEIGIRLGQEYGIPYLVSDFKKRGGYLKSIDLSKEYGLYRQDYCGCEYSKRQRESARNGMEEIWDVYDGNGVKTGRTMERGVPVDGDYMLCVHVYLCSPEGLFLMQKRSESKQSHPGEWDVTGGAVLSGESSTQGAIRETREEVGILLSEENLTYIGRVKKRRSFIDIYLARKDFTVEECRLQREEVEEVKLVPGEEVLRLEQEKRKRERDYVELLRRMLLASKKHSDV